MQNFRDLKVWQKAHQVTLEIYRATAAFPREELFNLTSQLRRAAYSVPFNLAEGCGLATDKGRANATQIAIGSACEVDYALLLARDLGYLPVEIHTDLESKISEIRRMLIGLASHFRGE